jgi:hypothetical protein
LVECVIILLGEVASALTAFKHISMKLLIQGNRFLLLPSGFCRVVTTSRTTDVVLEDILSAEGVLMPFHLISLLQDVTWLDTWLLFNPKVLRRYRACDIGGIGTSDAGLILEGLERVSHLLVGSMADSQAKVV